MKIEELFSSKTRMEILKLLFDSDELNVSKIAEEVGSDFMVTRAHLDVLADEGILKMTLFGARIRFYKFNEQSPKAQAVKTLLETWSKN